MLELQTNLSESGLLFSDEKVKEENTKPTRESPKKKNVFSLNKTNLSSI